MFSIRCNNYIKPWENQKNPQRIQRIKPFTSKYNWKGINYPSGEYECKT